jgi:hypothetical protein
MKSITEILGGAQILLGITYDIQDSFEEYLNGDQRAFLAMLRIIEDHLPNCVHSGSGLGRPAYAMVPFRRAFLARSFFRIPSMDDLRKRLHNDPNLRMICGFDQVPSLATFSRRLSAESDKASMTKTLNSMARSFHEGKIVGHISRDSTAIPAREKPTDTKAAVALPQTGKPKTGRPRKGESPPEKKPTRLNRQIRMKPGKSLSELNMQCSWGCKKNSQGNAAFWRGYKLHLDITELGVPVTAIVTGAKVHDSQLAIPMEKLTERKITFLYSLMDSAYDAKPIVSYIRGKGRIELIDHQKRRGDGRPPFDPAQKARFKIRSSAERANAHLKDWLLPVQLHVRGIKKVSYQIMCGVVCLAALKILQYYVMPPPQPMS